MARGQQTPDELKEQIRAALASNNNVREIARQFKVSPSTVMKIRDEKPDEFEQLRTDKKQQMIDKIWASLVDAADLGHSMIKEAKQGAREIPLNQVSTFYGTMYDKMALMQGENTQNIGGSGINVVLNMPDVASEDQWNK
ncbi:hypothetical protein [Paenibacillus spongiae]|uniref:Helix-turn-helix domain-containing protein n=1 Tax=Paenibacillus spongiae TaxID=2909671 RepID=A0ABY5SB78_9BACL|nr:hypothetical protein [Paenibacillus spongiae]UVI31207.1 hypothetical protein L1F29_05015 [Paenibacillus spongiae]